MTGSDDSHGQAPSPLKRALLAIETLEQRLEAERRARTEPIAIVGASCRFPGGIDDLEAYWAFLRRGGEARREVPPERWDAEAYYDPDPEVPGTMVSRLGGFRDAIDGFDAGFFGISPREAAELDPQHRLVLEAAWEALEDAGRAPGELVGSRTGVFVGLMNADYGKLQVRPDDYRAVGPYTTTGSEPSFAAGRIAYVLGLQGPCVAVDTACSSSLVAVHQACQSLRTGECSLALAGGVSLMVTPELGVFLTKARILAPDGRCKTFDASADGIGRGEGGAMVVLKRLRDAKRDGDRILCVIRGSAINHDGRSGGLTVPSGSAQEALIRAALADAGVDPSRVGYVEAHGTGTPLGDLVEARALAAVFGPGRLEPLYIGSVKTNLGHLDAAAGMAGLLKVALALRHAELPPHLHLRDPNPEIPWRAGHLEVPTAAMRWPAAAGSPGPRAPRTAGVSSFGLSGVNAHVVLEEPPAPVPAPVHKPAGPLLLTLSARSDAAVRQLAGAYASLLRRPATESGGLEDVVVAASLGREHHEQRIAVLDRDREHMAASLEELARGGSSPHAWRGSAPSGSPPRVGFVFCGMGVSALGVGRQLVEREPVFGDALEQAGVALQRHADLSVMDLVRATDGARPMPIDVLQPLVFGLGVALSALWRSWGVEPDAVVGHSMGEVIAAHVAGVLSLDDAARVICARSRLLRRASGHGAMAVVELPAADLVERLATLAPVAIAAINGPRATVISGDPVAVDSAMRRLAAEGVECRRLDVDVAFHGPQMDLLMAPLRAELAGLAPREGTCTLYSTVTGRPCSGSELGPDHWARNLRETVRFAPAVTELVAHGEWLLVEVGPHPILRPHLRATAPAARLASSLRRGVDEHEAMMGSLAEAYVGGAAIRWRGVYPGRRPAVRLPTYPWQRERHWVAARREPAPRSASARGSSHPQLGTELDTALRPRVTCFERQLDTSDLGELADHRVRGAVLLPGTAIADMALAVGAVALGSPVSVRDLVFRAPLRFEDDAGPARTIQTSVERGPEGRGSFQLASRTEAGTWLVHATGEVEAAPAEAGRAVPDEGWRKLLDGAVAPEPGPSFYEDLARRGLEYGPAFRGIRTLWRGTDEALAELGPRAKPEGHHVSPALLDAGLHALLAVLPPSAAGLLMVPVGIGRLHVHERPTSAHTPLRSHARLRADGEDGPVGDVRLFSADGEVLVEAEGVRLRPLEPLATRPLEELLLEPLWPQAPRPEPRLDGSGTGARWLLVARQGSMSARVEAAAQRRGVEVTRVPPGSVLPSLAGHSEVLVLCGDPSDAVPPTADAMESAQAEGVGAALAVTQELSTRDVPPGLWLVTSRAQAMRPKEPVVPTHAPVWGLGRTLGYELPQLRCVLVDVEGEDEAEALVEEVLARPGDPEVGLRSHGRHIGRLARGTVPAERAFRVRSEATHLVTGGLGGLGASVAEWLVEQGARHLVLVSRRGVTTDAQRLQLARLRERGCEVEAEAVDVADEAAVAALLARVERTMPALATIVHAAGVLEDGTLTRGDAGWLRRVMAPKVRGAWNLHRLTLGLELDAFVLYGSVSALLGSPGQGNYAAGNAFMQALAHHRRAQGQPATCIDWGAFSEVGMAAALGIRGDRLQDRGMGSIRPQDGLDALARIVGRDVAQVGVADLDVLAWIESYPHLQGSSRLAMLVASAEARQPAPSPSPSGSAASLRARLVELPAADHRPAVEAHVRAEVARVLRLDPASIEPTAPLTGLGVDSLMAIELRNRLEVAAGLRLPVATFMQGNGVEHVARVLLDHLTSESLLDSVRDAAEAGDEDGWEVITL